MSPSKGKQSRRSTTTLERLQRSIAARRGEVVLRRDVSGFGSASQVSRSLNQLVADGKLVRIGIGVYAKATPSRFTGRPAPRQVLEVLAVETFARLGIAWQQGRACRRYNAGFTNQVPWRTTFDTGPRRISRRLQVGQCIVEYENDFQPKPFSRLGRKAARRTGRP